MAELMTLVETGTRALLGAVFGPPATGETDYARRLLHLLDDTMLVLCDRGFDAGDFLTEVTGAGAAFLTRLCATRRLPVLTRLRDGSYLSTIAASKTLTVRIITAEVTVTCADGTRYTATYRPAATLLDPRRYPAAALIALYHQRWEHEIAYLALRHTLCQHRVLRSGDPGGLTQEMWGLPALYQALRIAMLDAIESVPGADPDRASFTTALETAKDQLVTAGNIIPDDVDLVGDIGRAVLDDPLSPRRPRTSVRKVKSPLSKYHKKDPYRPERSTPITSLTVAINDPEPKAATRQPKCLTRA
ncbi:transposase, partial [Candidatus Mycobacterium methanotrophicum]